MKGAIEIGGFHIAQSTTHGRNDKACVCLRGALIGDHRGSSLNEQLRWLQRWFGQHQPGQAGE